VIQQMGVDLYGFGASLITKTWMLQRVYNWQVIMTATISGLPGYWISQYCQGIKFRDYAFDQVVKLRYGSEQRGYPGDQAIEPIIVTFLSPTDQSVYNYFKFWRKQVLSEAGYYKPKKEYAHDVHAILYDGNLETNRFRLRGCWPLDLPVQDLSYEADEVVRYSVTLNVDKIEAGSELATIFNITRVGKQVLSVFK